MKPRDYVFWITLTFASLFIGHWLKLPGDTVVDPAAPHQATSFERATYWLAVWRLAHAAPRTRPQRQVLPDAVVNAPAERAIGPDGEPLLDHSAGW